MHVEATGGPSTARGLADGFGTHASNKGICLGKDILVATYWCWIKFECFSYTVVKQVVAPKQWIKFKLVSLQTRACVAKRGRKPRYTNDFIDTQTIL